MAEAESADEQSDDAERTDAERAEDLRAQVDLLRAENRRLREEYRRARQAGYRRTAIGLGGVGAVAVLAGLLFPAAREVLFVLGAIGVFGGVLTRYLTPGRFVAAETGERVYAAHADTLGALLEQLGLDDTHEYVPVAGEPPARLFVPQHREHDRPDDDALEHPLVVGDRGDERGVSIVPAGGTLFREFESSLAGSLGSDPGTVVEQVADALVEGFELARTVDPDVDTAGGRATLSIGGAVYDDADLPDNPLGSLLAVALAEALSTPVRLETGRSGEELVVTCRWDANSVDEESENESSESTSDETA